MVLSQRAHDRVSRKSTEKSNVSLPVICASACRPADAVTRSTNWLLASMECLAILNLSIREIAGVGDNIAHDLRTPLTRVRVRLERGRAHASTLNELRTVVDQAIGGLDQSLAIITALLRIAEIEHSRRLEGFQPGAARPAGTRDRRSLRANRRRQRRHPSGRILPMRRRFTATAIFCSRPSPIWSTTP